MTTNAEAAIPGVQVPDPMAGLAAVFDARIDAKLQELLTYVDGQFDNIYRICAELESREVGVAYREFVVSEARRLNVRPAEVLNRGTNPPEAVTSSDETP